MRSTPSLALALLATAGIAGASHDEIVGARFVQPGGVDAGNCLDHHAPCVSMQYALAQAEPGNTVKVGAGIFDLRGIDPETFLHGPVHATGGYDDADHFYESRPVQVRSIVTGVDARYRHALAVRGFYWAESVAAARRNVVSFDGRRRIASRAALRPPTACKGCAGQFPCRNLDFQSQVPLAQLSSAPVSAANVWGFVDLNDNREYAVLGLRNGTAIVDVTDPANPREVVTIAGNPSPWREVKVYQVFDAGANRWRAYAYVDDRSREQRRADDRPVGAAADGRARVDEHGHELAAHAVRLEHRLCDERRVAGPTPDAVRRRQQSERRLVARV